MAAAAPAATRILATSTTFLLMESLAMAGVIAGRHGLPIVSERRPTAASVADFQNTDRTIRPIRLPPCRCHQTGTMGTISDANRPPNLRFRNDRREQAVDA